MASNVSTLIITVLSALTFVHCEPWHGIRRQYAAEFSEEPAGNYRGLDSVYVGSYTPTAYHDSYYGRGSSYGSTGRTSSGSTGRTFGGKKMIVKKKVGTGGGRYIVGEGTGSGHGSSGSRWKKIGGKWKKVGGKWKKIGSGHGSIGGSRKLIDSGLGSVYGTSYGSGYGSRYESAGGNRYLSDYGEGSGSGSPYIVNGLGESGTDSKLGSDVPSPVSDPDGSRFKYTFGSDDFWAGSRSRSLSSTGGIGFGPVGLSSPYDPYASYGSEMFGPFNVGLMSLGAGDGGVVGPYPDPSKPCMKFWYDENGDFCSDPALCDEPANGPSGGSATTAAPGASTTPAASSASSSATTAASTTAADDAMTVDAADETKMAGGDSTTVADDETITESDDDDDDDDDETTTGAEDTTEAEHITEAEDITMDGGAAADPENGDEEEAPSGQED